jgi:multidrug efflux system membrane fusion protein
MFRSRGPWKRRMRISSWTLTSLSFFTAVFPAACGKEPRVAPPPVPVAAAQVIQKDVPVQIKAVGTVGAENTVTVRSRLDGQILKVYVREGRDVKKGELLFVIDPRAIEANLRQAEATLARDEVQSKNADIEANRYAFLVEKGYVSRDQYDQFRTTAEALKATVKADRAAVDNLRVQLQYCYIRSPINGRTGSLLVDEGNVVKNNDTALLTINRIMPIQVAFSVPEKYLSNIKRYRAGGELKVEVLIPGDKTPEVGAVFFIDNSVDPATGTIRLKGRFPNPDRHLWPGQFVNTVLTLTTQKGAVVIPSQAIQTGQQGTFVFVVKPDLTAEMRPISVNRSLNGETVINKGVSPGETVVTDGQIRLVPGSRVEIKTGGQAGTS